jgi:hypothetical protein
MSQTNEAGDEELQKYRGTTGAEIKTANVSEESHPLKQELGSSDEAKERVYDSKIAGQRFVEFYDDTAASIREYLSNAETACIRRARHELLDSGFSESEIPREMVEMLEMAEEEEGYEPLIEVTYRRKPEDTRLVIEDNGIGISVEEYQVLQRIGYSTSHAEGGRLGKFGMGFMSGFQLTGIDGMFKMTTKSYVTGEAYSTAEYVANCEYLDQTPTEPGTRFEFPSFGQAAQSIDIASKVEEFADGMTIPVLYRDFRVSGQESSASDDFLATRIEDEYPDDAMVIVFENEFFKAVMSPKKRGFGRGHHTYNISMPIRRNTDEYGRAPKFKAKWSWDYRGKQEDGPIVHCPSDESLVGLIPKEDVKYNRMMDELKERCVPMSEVPDDAISMAEPASSRDSFKSGNDEYWRHVSEQLQNEWKKVAREHLNSFDTWQDFKDMEREDKETVLQAYRNFGASYGKADPDTIAEVLSDTLGVSMDPQLAFRLHQSQGKVSVVNRGSNAAHTKAETERVPIWEVLDNAPDGVYMGVSVSQKKADIVWGLGETDVVRLEDTSEYDRYESDWGWKKMKSLPSRNLAEKLPQLDDDVVERYDGVTASESNNTRQSLSTGGNGKNPETCNVIVRVGTNNRKYFSTQRVKSIAKQLKSDSYFSAGRHKCEYLVLADSGATAEETAEMASRDNGVAAVSVPNYVYEYLAGFDNVYESLEELYDDKMRASVTLSDGTTMGLRELPETDMLLSAGSEAAEHFQGRGEDLAKILGYDTARFNRYTFIDPSELDGSWGVEVDATVVRTTSTKPFKDFKDYTYRSVSLSDVILEDVLGSMDKESAEYQALFGARHGQPSESEKRTLIDIAVKAGLNE